MYHHYKGDGGWVSIPDHGRLPMRPVLVTGKRPRSHMRTVDMEGTVSYQLQPYACVIACVRITSPGGQALSVYV